MPVRNILTFLLAALCGGFLGATITAYQAYVPRAVTIIDDAGTDIPVVHIDGILNGTLQGSAEGNVRISAGEDNVIVDADGRFSIDDRSILVNRITVQAPPGMQFVASSKGTKYYAVDSSAGQNIVPQNRVYFKTAEEAEAAGFRK